MCYIILDITYSHQNLVVSAPPAVLSVRNSPVSTIESIHVPPVASSVRRHRLVVVLSSSCRLVVVSLSSRIVVVSSSSRRRLVVVSSSSRRRLVVVSSSFRRHLSSPLRRAPLSSPSAEDSKPPMVPRTTLVPLENLKKLLLMIKNI